ncbi:hypothetical protein BKA62DRAFT_724636 [Auriculariales sp. MPI-PUGE-AT-0066]|nr:hypothetical protein BKA62DRAFT_724636 [Auriculariales sp. MPI-PUGE-AT-0066]
MQQHDRHEILSENLPAYTPLGQDGASLPQNVLRIIFWHLTIGPYNDTSFQKQHARAIRPFVVAAVCHSWRCAALNPLSSLMWSFLFVPARMRPRFMAAYVGAVLQRSHHAPIDIILEFCDEKYEGVYELLILVLAAARDRWYRFIAVISPNILQLVIDQLCQPTPTLKTLLISLQRVPSDVWGIQTSYPVTEAVIGNLLPVAPLLTRLSLVNTSTLWGNVGANLVARLSTLDVVQQHLNDHEVASQLISGSEISTLTIGAQSASVDGRPLRGVHLPMLRTLRIINNADVILSTYPEVFCNPHLESLHLQNCHILRFQAFFMHATATSRIIRLRLNTCLQFGELETHTLLLLSGIQDVELRATPVPTAFLVRLCETTPRQIMWPRLKRLVLDQSPVNELAVQEMRSEPGARDYQGRDIWSRFGIPAAQLHEIQILAQRPPNYAP